MNGRRIIAVLWCALILFCTRRASADGVERYAVVIGNNSGAPSEVQLKYAESDADRIVEALKDVGSFPPENVVLLKGERAPIAERALISTNDRLRAAITRGQEAILFVYFSGHADSTALHLGDTMLDLRLIEQLVRSSAATFRVLVIDACRSGALTRVKGGTAAAPFIDVRPQLDSQGAVFLTSSALGEDAQESDELKGSFFTHYFVSALLGAGDLDGDGRVTLEEAYRYAYQWTRAATSRTWAGTQHPTFQYDVRGQGGITMTEPAAHAKTRTTLMFPAGRDYVVMLGSASGAVVGEVPAGAKTRRLTLKPARYFVRGRARDHLLEGEISAEAGRTVDVRDDGLRRVEYARLARKGAGAPPAHGPEAGYALHSPLLNAGSWCHGAFVGYAFSFASVDLAARAQVCASSYENDVLRANVTEGDLGARIAIAHDLPWVTINAGATSGAGVLDQSFSKTTGVAPNRTSLAVYFGLNVGASADLGKGFAVFTEAGGRTYLFAYQDEKDRTRSIRPSVAFDQLLGLRKAW